MGLASKVVDFASEKDAFTLGACLWLHNQRNRSFALGTVISEFVEVVRKHPGEGEELEVIGVHLVQSLQDATEIVLPRYHVHAGKMVDLHIGFHGSKSLWKNAKIIPVNIEVIWLFLHGEAPLEFLP